MLNTAINKFVGLATATIFLVGLTAGCAAQSSALQRLTIPKSTPPLLKTQTSTARNPQGLMDPAKANLQVPAEFYAVFETSKGNFKVHVRRDWAPEGASRFYNMIESGYFENDIAIFRAIEGFMFQFGIHGDPTVNAKWANATIPDDESKGISNTIGTLSFAQTQLPNSRSVQMFVNLGHNNGVGQATRSYWLPLRSICPRD